MIAKRFEELLIWQKSKVATLDVYKSFEKCRDYAFKDQIQRAVVSIMNNIAEGFDKYSVKEFKRFLIISKGSCAEVRSMLYLAIELKYIDKNDFDLIYNQTIELTRMITSFIKTLALRT